MCFIVIGAYVYWICRGSAELLLADRMSPAKRSLAEAVRWVNTAEAFKGTCLGRKLYTILPMLHLNTDEID